MQSCYLKKSIRNQNRHAIRSAIQPGTLGKSSRLGGKKVAFIDQTAMLRFQTRTMATPLPANPEGVSRDEPFRESRAFPAFQASPDS
jgi:hypothetical protein